LELSKEFILRTHFTKCNPRRYSNLGFLFKKNMKIELTITKEFDVKYLAVSAGVRYWEDSFVNGIEDKDGTLIPCRLSDDEYWKPIIDLDTGIIINWDKGIKAEIHYKVCDDGVYTLLDSNNNNIQEIDGYVPSIMCPKGSGFGDYIIMDIDENGLIDNFNVDLEEFNEKED